MLTPLEAASPKLQTGLMGSSGKVAGLTSASAMAIVFVQRGFACADLTVQIKQLGKQRKAWAFWDTYVPSLMVLRWSACYAGLVSESHAEQSLYQLLD